MKHLGTIPLNTARLVLRRIKESDAKELFDGFINQDEFLYYANKKKVTLAEEMRSLTGIDEKYKDNEYYNWVIAIKDSGKIIGSINLRSNNYNDSVEFNYAIDNRYVGNGYMTEALAAVRDYCFDRLEVNRFQGGCCSENIASKRVMEKCGMRLEGTLADYIRLGDGYHDMYMYSITKKISHEITYL